MKLNERFNKDNVKEYIGHMEHEFGLIIKTCNIIKDVAVEFEGKRLNARFWKAIQTTIDQRLGVVKSDDQRSYHILTVIIHKPSSDISFFLFDRGFLLTGKTSPIYLDSDFSYRIYRFIENILEQGCISSNKVETILATYCNQLENSLAKYKDALQNWDEYIQEIEYVNKLIKTHISHINPLFIAENAKDLDGHYLSFQGKSNY